MYLQALERLKSWPPNEKYVLVAGLNKQRAQNFRTWLNAREGVTARTTGRKEELERYSEELRELGYDFTQLVPPNNHIVLAQYEQSTTE